MMDKSSYPVPLIITHIGTATTLIELDDLTIVTDPYFSPKDTVWTGASGAKLISSYQPGLSLEQLPPIDLVLLSHEDHKDNLDDLGRRLLDGRRVLTTQDGAKKLAPRPGVSSLTPWESVEVMGRSGRLYKVMGTPCWHLPGGECTGFAITADHFGKTDERPNAIYISGDTVYISELVKLKDQFHIVLATFNMGKATVPKPGGGGEMLQITMDGEQGVQLLQDLEPDMVIPLHYEGWNHFKETREELGKVLKKHAVESKFKFLELGVTTKIF
jgi:L-ascorbate metabolism protein UlaG (beta-lactamase superfamily)